MIKIYTFILFIMSCQLAIAQTNYAHDVAGNRIRRSKESGPLPVTLISFTASKEGSTALLTWQTSFEMNSDRFDIERSQDGKKWFDIGSVKASGDKTFDTQYSFTDKVPADGENLYRLKMVDRDGTFAYSRIQSLEFESAIVFFPNPVKDWLKISSSNIGSIQLINLSGKIIYQSASIPVNGIDMREFPTSMYLIKVILNDGSRIIRKIIKQ
jgi:hypothetical protein